MTLRPPVTDKDHAAGDANAPVTLVEYGDYECPHCGKAHPVVNAIRKQLGPQLRFVFRNFPLNEIHENAQHAAEAAESVAANTGDEAFWAMHDALYDNQTQGLDSPHLLDYAKSIGADSAAVKADLENGTFKEKVRADFMSGVRSGVNGTPTFFINGERFNGDWSNLEAFKAALLEASKSRA